MDYVRTTGLRSVVDYGEWELEVEIELWMVEMFQKVGLKARQDTSYAKIS